MDSPSSETATVADNGRTHLVFVTHHIEEIGPGVSHVLVLKGGRTLARGPKDDVLAPAVLSDAYNLPLEVDKRHGRLWVRVRGKEQAASPRPSSGGRGHGDGRGVRRSGCLCAWPALEYCSARQTGGGGTGSK